MLPRNSADLTHCQKTMFCFQSKAVYRAEDRPANIRLCLLPHKGTNLKCLILVKLYFFLTSRENQEYVCPQTPLGSSATRDFSPKQEILDGTLFTVGIRSSHVSKENSLKLAIGHFFRVYIASETSQPCLRTLI